MTETTLASRFSAEISIDSQMVKRALTCLATSLGDGSPQILPPKNKTSDLPRKMDIDDQNNDTRQSSSVETEEQRCQRQKMRYPTKYNPQAVHKSLRLCAAAPMKSKKPQKKLILLRI
ncbi:unnamed protein product [Larinioides sclopetarius]|uniref:Uncharacterized protein n=1 Tax=Larinioides sclopetarius TaxID=280406 RepID=A0AAV2AV48_9ARAC